MKVYFDRVNLYIGLTIVIIGIALFIYSFFVKFTLVSSTPGSTGSMFLPRYILLIWIFSGIAILFKPVSEECEVVNLHNLIYSTSLIFIFILLFERVGYLISSTVFFMSHAYFSGFRKKLILLTCSILSNFLIYYIFMHLLQMPLPEAPWQ